MTRVIPVMTVGTNVPEMARASAESANATRALLEHIVILYAQDMARAIATTVTATINGRVTTARFLNVQMTALEMAYATAPFSLVSVTQGGVGTTAVNLTVRVNRIAIIEARAQ